MDKLRYRCLVLDHDDTVTDSTAHVHYPAFMKAMELMHFDVQMTLAEYFQMNFDPGFMAYCSDTLHFTPEQAAQEHEIWQSCVRETVPTVYPGMAEIIRRQKAAGGFVCVASHSVDVNIRRDYRENGLPQPDLVYGWELPKEQRKPAPYALEQIMQMLSLSPTELLMVDDLKPGYDMAKACGVPFAGAGWAYDVPQIRRFMQQNCERYFTDPEQLAAFIFE